MDLPEFAIEARGVVKTYPATKTSPEMKALRGVDLAVNANEVHAVMGPNGSGKSTLAYALMGHPAYEISAGQILLDGDDRAIVLQREWEQVSFGEIAATLEIQENAARMRFQRAMGRLAQIVRRLEKGEIEELLQEAEKRDLS